MHQFSQFCQCLDDEGIVTREMLADNWEESKIRQAAEMLPLGVKTRVKKWIGKS